jgi:F0F1-type ATP synthase assembly protein I
VLTIGFEGFYGPLWRFFPEIWRPMKSEVPQDNGDDREPYAKAMQLASQIMSAGITMGLFAVGGYLLDRWLGWKGPFLIVGVLLGSVAFGWQMIVLVNEVSRNEQR